jgi:hypothetical protein
LQARYEEAKWYAGESRFSTNPWWSEFRAAEPDAAADRIGDLTAAFHWESARRSPGFGRFLRRVHGRDEPAARSFGDGLEQRRGGGASEALSELLEHWRLDFPGYLQQTGVTYQSPSGSLKLHEWWPCRPWFRGHASLWAALTGGGEPATGGPACANLLAREAGPKSAGGWKQQPLPGLLVQRFCEGEDPEGNTVTFEAGRDLPDLRVHWGTLTELLARQRLQPLLLAVDPASPETERLASVKSIMRALGWESRRAVARTSVHSFEPLEKLDAWATAREGGDDRSNPPSILLKNAGDLESLDFDGL